MSGRKNFSILMSFVLAFSLISSACTAMFMGNFYKHSQYKLLGDICQNIIEKKPETEQALSVVLKEYKDNPVSETDENILWKLGYHPSDFQKSQYNRTILYIIAGFLFGSTLFLTTLCYRNRKETLRIQGLADYLEQVNNGKAGLVIQSGEDDFSKLQDEIYKTVTTLYQMRDAALEARNHFADNLSNIAHQLKTPITAISLSAQMLKTYSCGEYPEQIKRQISRLTHLEEALLVLSRIDAGTLALEKKEIDVLTVLTLAVDNLQELFVQSGVSVIIPELGEVGIIADLDWTMEVFMNILKNCLEHTPSEGTVHCFYENNPLYTEIKIWDDGEGFAKEDIPHLFERFYRGQNAKEGSIGIGLPLAKEIIERQKGIIRAENIPSGGACFEIRFYSH